jgi:hypothetical protein
MYEPDAGRLYIGLQDLRNGVIDLRADAIHVQDQAEHDELTRSPHDLEAAAGIAYRLGMSTGVRVCSESLAECLDELLAVDRACHHRQAI